MLTQLKTGKTDITYKWPSASWRHLPARPLLTCRRPAGRLTTTIMHVQARGAQVRQANLADEIADGISLPPFSLYGAACRPRRVMIIAAHFNSVIME
jgi:hypothetical protein